MPKQKFKTEKCLNCGYQFTQEEDYCPQCGQENNDKVKSLRYFFRDFLDDVTQIDNRLYRSIPVFLFKPGKLSVAYLQGKRKHYVAPIRLYLVSSIIYVLILSWLTDFQADAKLNRRTRDFTNINEDTRKDSSNRSAKQDAVIVFYNIPAHKVLPLSDKGYTEAQIIDSLKLENDFMTRLAVRQTIRLGNASPLQLVQYVIEKIPMLMFVLLPVFALLLKLLYWRQKRYFVEHLVFALHLHSFFFVFFTLLLVALMLLSAYFFEILMLGLVLLLLYSLQAFRVMYSQSWLKTSVKISLLGFVYLMLLILSLAVGLALSLLFF